jgi:hypothetical protein
MHLSCDSDFTASELERALLAIRETFVLLDASIKGHAKRSGLVLEVCSTGLNCVNQSESDGL